MKIVTQDLTRGNLWKQIISFAVPLMFSNLLQVLFNLSDIAVVGRFGSQTALGSVGSTSTMVALFTGFLIGMGGGVNVLVARQFGARNDKDIRQLVHTAALLCLFMGLLVLTLGQIFTRPLLELLHTKDELMDGALLYLRIYLCGMPALGLYNFGNAVLSAVGDTRRPLAYLSASGVVNVLLNLFFVIVCGMDVAGVAIASAVSQYLSAALILAALLRTKESFGLNLRELHIYGIKAKSILLLGIPGGFQHSIYSIANLFIQAGINSFSAIVVAGNAAAVNCETICFQMACGVYAACASFIGQNLGAGNKERIKKSYLICLTYAAVIVIFFSAVFILFGRYFLRLFTTDPAVVEAGMVRVIIMFSFYWVAVLMDNSTAGCRGLGKTMVPTVAMIMGSCVFRIIWIYTAFARFHTQQVLYMLYPISWAITAAALMTYFIRLYKKQTSQMVLR